jgi:hypothetical protein
MSATAKLLRLLVTALGAAVAGGITFGAVSRMHYSHIADPASLGLVAGLLALFVLVPLGALVAFVAPTLIKRAGLRGAAAYAPTGAVAGWAAFSFPLWLAGDAPLLLPEALSGAAAGTVAGLLWWTLVERLEEQAEHDG